jgi:hypothetical protein
LLISRAIVSFHNIVCAKCPLPGHHIFHVSYELLISREVFAALLTRLKVIADADPMHNNAPTTSAIGAADGPRLSRRITLARRVMADCTYCHLEDPDVTTLMNDDLRSFLSGCPMGCLG